VNQRIPARVQLNLSAGRRDCRVAWRKLLSSSQECRVGIRAVQGGHRTRRSLSREKLRSEGLFKRKRIDDLKFCGDMRNPADRWITDKLRGDLVLWRRRQEPAPSHIGISRLASARVACTSKSRVAISRFNRSRQL
jgi:hypothetical protein